MPVIKTLHDNQFIGIYEEGSVRIIAKLALYESVISDRQYEILTEIKILDNKNNKIFYEGNTSIAYDTEGIVSIVNYAEQLALYANNCIKNMGENYDIYWSNLFISKFLKGSTTGLEIYYNRAIREQKDQDRIKLYHDNQNKIKELVSKIQVEYNKRDQACIYNFKSLCIFKKDRSIIDRQGDMKLCEMIDKYPELEEKYIHRRIDLDVSLNVKTIEILKREIKLLEVS